MIRWAHEGRTWPEIDKLILKLKLGGLESALRTAELLTDPIAAHLQRLKLGPEGKSIRLRETNEITDETLTLLAAAFSRSSPKSLLLPIVAMRGGAAK